MIIKIYISLLSIILSLNIVISEKARNSNKLTYTDNFQNNGQSHTDRVTLEREPDNLGGSGDGSGDSSFFDGDDEDFGLASGDGGTGSSELGKCERLRQEFKDTKQRDIAIPKCLNNGEFDRQQCDNDKCWCVNANGGLIARSESPKKSTDSSFNHRQQCIQLARRGDDSDIGLDPEDNDVRKAISAAGGSRGWNNEEDSIDVEFRTMDPDTNQIEMMQHRDSQQHFLRSSNVMRQPGILAGIIGGTVVGLLCATLLVMFIVYRTRKKDEGSYALDEPRRLPVNPAYVRANSKEYFA